MKKIFKSGLLSLAAIGLSFSLVQGTSAEEKIDGKCTISIDKSKHTLEKRAIATGKCSKLVSGYYGYNEFHVEGGFDGTVSDGEKYLVTVMPGFYTYEVTAKTISNINTLKAPVINSVGESDKKVTGTTEPKVKVTVKTGSSVLGSTKSDKNGNFTVKLKKAKKSGTNIKVIVEKGKESKSKTVKVKYKAPSVNAVKPSSTKVTGKTVAASKVIVMSGSETIGKATSSKNGSYSIKIKKQKVGTELSIKASKSGNETMTKSVVVK